MDYRYASINVLCAFRGFDSPKIKHKITPYRFELPDGRSHHIKSIRRTITQKVGEHTHFHFVVTDQDGRHFHIVFDEKVMMWKFVQEVDEQLFFNGI